MKKKYLLTNIINKSNNENRRTMKNKGYKMGLSLVLCFSLLFMSACGQQTNVASAANNNNVMSKSVSESTISNDDNEETKDDDIYVLDGTTIKAGETNLSDYMSNIKIESGGEYVLIGELNGMIYIDTEDAVSITLNGVTIKNDGPCIYAKNIEKVNIYYTNNNTLEDSVDVNEEYETLNAVIYCKSDLFISGDGTLKINANYEHGIKGKDNLTIESGNLTINSEKDCIHVNDDFIVNGGSMTLTSSSDECIQVENDIMINDGTIICNATNDAIKANNNIEINNGTITIEKANEGIESKNEITINNGTIKITSTDDCINASNKVEINGGFIYVVSNTNDGIDSNGSIVINDGTIYAVGLSTPECAIDVDNNDFVINGGTIIGLGSTTTKPTSVSQTTLLIGLENDIKSSDTVSVKILDESGNIVYFDDTLKVMEDWNNNMKMSNMENGNKQMDNTQNDMEFPQEFGQKPMEMNGNAENMDMPQDMPPMGMGFDENNEQKGRKGQRNQKGKQDTQWQQGERPNQFNENNVENMNMPQWSDNGQGMGNIERNGNGNTNMIISTNALKNGGTYTIYVNDELVDTVTVSDNLVEIGTLNVMGGGIGMNRMGR